MKKSMWFVSAVTVLYAVMNITRFFSAVSGVTWWIAMVTALVTPACVVVYVLCGDRLGKIGELLIPLAIAWMLIRKSATSLSTVRVVMANPQVLSLWFVIAFDVLLIVGMALMIVGSLQGFRRAALAQIGAFLSAGATVLYVVAAFIGAWVVSYFERVPDGVTAFQWIVFFMYVVTALFYAGIGVLAVEKKREKSLDFSERE